MVVECRASDRCEPRTNLVETVCAPYPLAGAGVLSPTPNSGNETTSSASAYRSVEVRGDLVIAGGTNVYMIRPGTRSIGVCPPPVELVENKRAAGRPKDLADVALLEDSQAVPPPRRAPRHPGPRAKRRPV